MACLTLKRSQDFDLLDSNPTKRRKFNPYGSSYIASDLHNDSPFTPAQPTIQASLKKRIKDEIKRLQRRRLIPRLIGSQNCTMHSSISEDNAAVASCSGSFRCMALRSPHHDHQDLDKVKLPLECSPPSSVSVNKSVSASPPPISPSSSSQLIRTSSTLNAADAPLPGRESQSSSLVIDENSKTSVTPAPSARPSACPVCISRTLDTVPIFTLPQVTSLCDRLIREREAELRQEYDNILSCKLAEQYEAFLKFSHDQLSSRFHNAPMSYVS